MRIHSPCSGIPVVICGLQNGCIFMVEVTGAILDEGLCDGWWLVWDFAISPPGGGVSVEVLRPAVLLVSDKTMYMSPYSRLFGWEIVGYAGGVQTIPLRILMRSEWEVRAGRHDKWNCVHQYQWGIAHSRRWMVGCRGVFWCDVESIEVESSECVLYYVLVLLCDQPSDFHALGWGIAMDGWWSEHYHSMQVGVIWCWCRH